MVIDSLKNLHLYNKQFPFLNDVIEFIAKNDIHSIVSPKISINDRLYIVTIVEEQSTCPDPQILEAHREWVDIHCTIKGEDKVAYKSTETCKTIEKAYDPVDDYILYKERADGCLTIKEEYFCLIQPNMAHMALCGQGAITKLVFKARIVD